MKKYKHMDTIKLEKRKWPDNRITEQPVFCSVDLRDGNQALSTPMSVENKLKLFRLLVTMGFREIEVGFPAASQIDYDFVRKLIDDQLIPDGVFIQILLPCIEKYIIRSLESVQGAKNVILHLYNSTSTLQRRVTFNKTKEEVKALAVEGTRVIKNNLDRYLAGVNVVFEYSPESFSDTETDYALEVCEAVMDVWQPTTDKKMILNLPETVQWATPNVFADQIEWFCTHMRERDKAIISVHTHNDRGTGIASAELSLLAGAERVEGTLFGNGERTGNLDILALAVNMFSDGIDLDLDISNIPHVRQVYEETTGMDVHERHPYAGDLVFTAFSGSHQDAIKKGMDLRKKLGEGAPWEVPYLPVDPKDLGRSYEAIIRINSQSGKGGVAYVLENNYGLVLPKVMHPDIGTQVNIVSDRLGRELSAEEIYGIFTEKYFNINAPFQLIRCNIRSEREDKEVTLCDAEVSVEGKFFSIHGRGNGPIDSFAFAMRENGFNDFKLLHFSEQSIGEGTDTGAVSYIQIQYVKDVKETFWGVGNDSNISLAGIKALVSAYNNLVGAHHGD